MLPGQVACVSPERDVSLPAGPGRERDPEPPPRQGSRPQVRPPGQTPGSGCLLPYVSDGLDPAVQSTLHWAKAWDGPPYRVPRAWMVHTAG